jgi:hypothetical protein
MPHGTQVASMLISEAYTAQEWRMRDDHKTHNGEERMTQKKINSPTRNQRRK